MGCVEKEFVLCEACGESEESLVLSSDLLQSYKSFWVFRVIRLEWFQWS